LVHTSTRYVHPRRLFNFKLSNFGNRGTDNKTVLPRAAAWRGHKKTKTGS